MLGIVVEMISNHFGINSSNSVDVPVTFAPGRARLATSPDSTGSPFTDMTTGIVVVAFFAARVDGMQVPTIAAGSRLNKDAASCRNSYAEAQCTSMTTFLPSIQTNSRSPSLNAPRKTPRSASDAQDRSSMFGIFASYTCAKDAHGAARAQAPSVRRTC